MDGALQRRIPSTADRPISIRRRKPSAKVKTGCITCKIRRVKCDEEKPTCKRCLNFGVVCDGYQKPGMKTLGDESRTRTIQPKPQSKSVALLAAQKPIPIKPHLASVAWMRSGTGFEEELAGQCFRIYLEDTANQIGGPFPSSLWGQLIPQISEIEPFVRHAVIAIGALSKQSKTKSTNSIEHSTGWHREDYEYALLQYGRAVRGMREAISNGQHDLRKALVACLLVFCFEGMLGNQASASLHAESGLMLLHQWTTRQNPSSEPWLTEKLWKDKLFEGELLEAFVALDSQVLIFMDHRSATIHDELKRGHSRLIKTMPQEFYNLELARQFWKLIINRNYHFSKQIQVRAMEKAKEAILEDSWEGSAKMSKDELLLSKAATESSDLEEEQRQYQNDIARWCAACSKLFSQIDLMTNQREKVGAAILQVQTKMSHMMLAGNFFTKETEYDAFLTEFAAIVDLSELVLLWILGDYEGSSPRFHFDVGIVAALFFVASRCRVDALRMRAMDMLFAANYREGIWDAQSVAHMAKWLRQIELQDLAPGDIIPEEKRVVLNAVNVDLFNKRALVGALQGPKGAGIQHKVLLSW